MTATDELRRLLDERGVECRQTEWVDGTTIKWHGSDKIEYGARNGASFDGPTGRLVLYGIDPEQAVEATLGRGTCRMTRVENEKRILHGWMECSECGPVYPPAAECIQDAVKFCPYCGRKVMDA